MHDACCLEVRFLCPSRIVKGFIILGPFSFLAALSDVCLKLEKNIINYKVISL
jgi:hypothetical protein